MPVQCCHRRAGANPPEDQQAVATGADNLGPGANESERKHRRGVTLEGSQARRLNPGVGITRPQLDEFVATRSGDDAVGG